MVWLYVIFTGTTGRPKGVIISHSALIIQSLAKIAMVGYSEDDVRISSWTMSIFPLFVVCNMSIPCRLKQWTNRVQLMMFKLTSYDLSKVDKELKEGPFEFSVPHTFAGVFAYCSTLSYWWFVFSHFHATSWSLPRLDT